MLASEWKLYSYDNVIQIFFLQRVYATFRFTSQNQNNYHEPIIWKLKMFQYCNAKKCYLLNLFLNNLILNDVSLNINIEKKEINTSTNICPIDNKHLSMNGKIKIRNITI